MFSNKDGVVRLQCYRRRAKSPPFEARGPVEAAAPEYLPGDVYRAPPEVAATLPLQLGDRVCWISDHGPELGGVGWIGKLPAEDGGRDWMVGVEFDKPVGSGNGCYRGHRLFAARLHHASIVPITGLMRAEDLRPASPELASAGRQPAAPSSARSRNLEVHTSSSDEEGGAATPPVPARPQTAFTDDLRHMTAFHRMAYEQLRGGRTPSPSLLERLGDEPTQCAPCKPCLSRSPEAGSGRAAPLSELSSAQTVPSRRLGRRRESPQPTPPAANHILNAVEAAWTDPEMTVGSAVEVDIQGLPQYGVIRWIGHVRGDTKRRTLAGVEMEDDGAMGGDGTFHGVRYFTCSPGKALFIPLVDCSRDRRFLDVPREVHDSNAFGSVECPVISGNVAPITVTSIDDLNKLCGKLKGIQGHLNSCYLDATLFSMFAFTPVLDSLLHRPARPGDIPEYGEVQRLLKEEIVNPLRSGMFVRADRVMKLRQMLEMLSSVRGLTSEEKDPEEFLQSLLAQMLHADPFLRYSSGQESYLYQLIVERDDRLLLPSVQQLFDQSFISGHIKLKEIPSCLIVQMPRFGKDYKMYSRILPSMVLDVTDVIENSPRQCFVCGRLAEWECKDCFDQGGLGLMTTAFCTKCNLTSHSHQSRSSHAARTPLKVPRQFTELRQHAHITRCYLELFAVVCIHTSHYVSFTKTGCGPDAGWVFFDSMADRKGEANGYNIPEVVSVPDLARWLTEDGRRGLLSVSDDRRLPEHARRLLCDGFMCFYQSRDVMMYR